MNAIKSNSPELTDILNDLERVKIRLEMVEKKLKKKKSFKTKQTGQT